MRADANGYVPVCELFSMEEDMDYENNFILNMFCFYYFYWYDFIKADMTAMDVAREKFIYLKVIYYLQITFINL
jgi:hypothetical protein